MRRKEGEEDRAIEWWRGTVGKEEVGKEGGRGKEGGGRRGGGRRGRGRRETEACGRKGVCKREERRDKEEECEGKKGRNE